MIQNESILFWKVQDKRNFITLRINTIITLYYQDSIGCRCKYQNGGIEENEIVCDTNGTEVNIGGCNSDEWCTGNALEDFSTRSNTLCKKGNKRSVIIDIISLIIAP